MNSQLQSERVIVEAPMSFTGSAKRIWRLTGNSEGGMKWVLGTLAVVSIVLAWAVILCWYVIFGLLVVPYRLVRRGQRKRKLEDARHRELLAATQQQLPARPVATPASMAIPQPPLDTK